MSSPRARRASAAAARSPAPTARRVADGWRIDGRKTFASLSPALDAFVIPAAVEGAEAFEGIGRFLVPRGDGVRIESTWDPLGMRGTGSDDIVLEGVVVPEDALLYRQSALAPDPNASNANAWFTLLLSSVYLGIADAALNFAARYAGARVPTALGRPLATVEGVQRRLGEAELDRRTASTVLTTVARAWDDAAWAGDAAGPGAAPADGRAVVLGSPPRLGLPSSGSEAHAFTHTPRPTTSAHNRANASPAHCPPAAAAPIVWVCMATASAVDASPAASRRCASTDAPRPAPRPPSAAGTANRGQPIAQSAATWSAANVPARSWAAAPWAKRSARAVARAGALRSVRTGRSATRADGVVAFTPGSVARLRALERPAARSGSRRPHDDLAGLDRPMLAG